MNVLIRYFTSGVEHLPSTAVSDLAHPYRKVAEFEEGHPITLSPALPACLRWD